MKSYLEKMEKQVDETSFKLLVRAAVNWCNGTLMGISGTRKRLAALLLQDGEVPTIDTVAGDEGDTEAQARERAHDLGFAMSEPELKRRGEAFASIRRFCMELAEERGWDGFDKPRDFKTYIESRINGLRTAQITDADIKREMLNSIGTTAAEARAWLVASNRKQAARIEEEAQYLIAEDGSYSDELDPDEAIGVLGVMSEHRMRTKFISSLCFEADRINLVRQDYPNFEELRTKRHMLLCDAIKLQDELALFELDRKQDIQKAMRENDRMTLIGITEGHRIRLKLTREALEEEKRLRKEIMEEQIAKERNKQAA